MRDWDAESKKDHSPLGLHGFPVALPGLDDFMGNYGRRAVGAAGLRFAARTCGGRTTIPR